MTKESAKRNSQPKVTVSQKKQSANNKSQSQPIRRANQ
jgi:hypothetical protein